MTATPITVEQIDPASLLVDVNIRTQTTVDKDFTASIRELGVLVPIVAVRTPDGSLRVRHGHRRTLASVETGRASVPVVIVGDDDANETQRIIGQWHENEHRAGLSTTDKLAAVEQLSLLGLSAAQIVRRTKARKAEVEQALAASASALAKGATARYDFLTLDQAAGIAEFDTDPTAVKALVVAAKSGEGEFAHVLQRARDARAEAAEIAALTEQLATEGTLLVARPEHSDKAVRPLGDLTSATGGKITPDKHRSCPGHAAYIRTGWHISLVYVCTDWKAHGHLDRYGTSARPSGPMDETAKAERREVVANNKAWKSATTVRRNYLATMLARKTPPKGSAVYVAGELALGTHALRRAMDRTPEIAASLLGVDLRADRHGIEKLADTANDQRAQVIALALVLAAVEDSTGTHTWRNPDETVGRYLAFLVANGYTLSDVERLAAAANNKKTRKPSLRMVKDAPATAETVAATGDTSTTGGDNVSG